MGIYAESISDALTQFGLGTDLFKPQHSLESSSFSRMAMRYLRYVQYPWMVKRANRSADVHHVIDHGYAHLHPRLPNTLSVVTVHDLIPFLTWKGVIPADLGWQDTADRQTISTVKRQKPRLNIHSLNYLKYYDRIIAVSQSTANDLSLYLNIPAAKIHVVPPVISSNFYRCDDVAAQRMRDTLSVGENTKVILITGREYYKNLRSSINVLENLLAQGHDVKLIRSGLPCPEFDQYTAARNLTGSVTSIYLATHEELPVLYSAVDCLLFPSWYEGFGMPVAEALACGTPVVCSDRGSLSEIGGDLALKAAPDDISHLSDLVWRCMVDKEHQHRVRKLGPISAQQYQAPRVANRLIDAYGV